MAWCLISTETTSPLFVRRGELTESCWLVADPQLNDFKVTVTFRLTATASLSWRQALFGTQNQIAVTVNC
jgi:hypothetical protein